MPRVSPVSQGICYRDDYCQPRHENRNDEINFVDGCFKGLGIAAFVLYIGEKMYNNRENIKNGAKSFWNWQLLLQQQYQPICIRTEVPYPRFCRV